jgi:hypothetical protein
MLVSKTCGNNDYLSEIFTMRGGPGCVLPMMRKQFYYCPSPCQWLYYCSNDTSFDWWFQSHDSQTCGNHWPWRNSLDPRHQISTSPQEKTDISVSMFLHRIHTTTIWIWWSQICDITYEFQHTTLLSPVPIYNWRICQDAQHSISWSCRVPMYASLRTHPDITYAVQTLSCFTTKPRLAHWEAIKHVFCYLKGTKGLWLSYRGKRGNLIGYADADGNMAEDCYAISEYAFLLYSGAILRTTKWQEIISLSTTKSKYVAATYASKEALWLCFLLSQLFEINSEPVTLFSNNQSAIVLTKDHQYHGHTKHIDICSHFIC